MSKRAGGNYPAQTWTAQARPARDIVLYLLFALCDVVFTSPHRTIFIFLELVYAKHETILSSQPAVPLSWRDLSYTNRRCKI